jgi:hypothetical protein
MLKQEARSPFPHKFAAYIFSTFKLQFQQQFLDLEANEKGIFIF